MPDKVFIDTNIVIYSLGESSTKAHLAAPLFLDRPCISTQVLSETANVTTKRLGLATSEGLKETIAYFKKLLVVQFDYI